MAASQAHPRFLAVPLLAAKLVHVRPRLDCIAASRGDRGHPLVEHIELSLVLLHGGISTSLQATPCTEGTQRVGLGSHGSLSLASEFDASVSLGQGCSPAYAQTSNSLASMFLITDSPVCACQRMRGPHLRTSMQEGSTALMSASMITSQPRPPSFVHAC
jgi:hypothetical protein